MPAPVGKSAATRDTAVYVENLNQVLRALSKIDKDLQQKVRDASVDIATEQLGKSRAAAQTPLQQMVAGALTVRRDRVPVIYAGPKRLRAQTKLTDVFYGAEFGGGARSTTRQFLPHKGRRGYFLYPTLRANSRRYYDMWADACDEAFEAWNDRAGSGVL